MPDAVLDPEFSWHALAVLVRRQDEEKDWHRLARIVDDEGCVEVVAGISPLLLTRRLGAEVGAAQKAEAFLANLPPSRILVARACLLILWSKTAVDCIFEGLAPPGAFVGGA